MPQRHPVVRQVYVVGAVLAFVGTFMPLFAGAQADGYYATRTLWTLIGEDGGGAALVGVLVVLGMVVATLVASGAERGFRAPGAVLLLAFVAFLMLVLKPGTGGNPPSLGAGGGLLLGTTLVLAATALFDVLGTPRAAAPVVPSQGSTSPRIRWQ